MRFDLEETVAMPRAELFARLSDLDTMFSGLGLEGAHMVRRGGDQGGEPGSLGAIEPGAVWDGRIGIKGVERDITAEVTEVDAPSDLGFVARVAGLRLDAHLTLTETAPERTHVAIGADLAAASIGGRVLMQAVRMAGGEIEPRLQSRLSTLARRLERG